MTSTSTRGVLARWLAVSNDKRCLHCLRPVIDVEFFFSRVPFNEWNNERRLKLEGMRACTSALSNPELAVLARTHFLSSAKLRYEECSKGFAGFFLLTAPVFPRSVNPGQHVPIPNTTPRSLYGWNPSAGDWHKVVIIMWLRELHSSEDFLGWGFWDKGGVGKDTLGNLWRSSSIRDYQLLQSLSATHVWSASNYTFHITKYFSWRLWNLAARMISTTHSSSPSCPISWVSSGIFFFCRGS